MREIKFRTWNPNSKKMGNLFCSSVINGETIRGLGDCILMQYTSLKDENDKEIYEGDIVRLPGRSYGDKIYDEEISQVEWDVFGFYIARQGACSWSEMEVIGNIYENPDLLTQSIPPSIPPFGVR